jgi:hypothetical protein
VHYAKGQVLRAQGQVLCAQGRCEEASSEASRRLLRHVARDRKPKSKLNKRVAQLERDPGVRLIERSTGSVQVNEIGAT